MAALHSAFTDVQDKNSVRQHLPNLLTVLRLILAAVFFLVLNQYRYGSSNSTSGWILWSALVLFVLAALTDWLDGYLARRWKAESTFGRIMDPVCDKVLVLGAFIYLCGPRFVIPQKAAEFFNMASGVYPWMVAVILARELLVTSIRAELEVRGVRFGANLSGKLKMVLQSVVVPVILFLVWLDPVQQEWAAWCRDILVYVTVGVTILSGLPYIRDARRALKNPPKKELPDAP